MKICVICGQKTTTGATLAGSIMLPLHSVPTEITERYENKIGR